VDRVLRILLVATLLTSVAAPALAGVNDIGFDPETGALGDGLKGVAPLGKSPGQTYGTALAAMRVKNYRTAVHLLGELSDTAPGRVEVWRLLGAAYAGEARWDASRRAYERALKLAPDDLLSHAGRAQALVALNDPAAAEEAKWLKARSEACAGACPEAATLKALETSGPFAPAAS
jgi:tetratricopeptide (TPR) repeat protein